LRVDAGVEAGTAVTTHYDPLLAKLMAHGDDRAAALARLGAALAAFDIGGVQTTLPFHRWLLAQAGFVAGDELATDYVARAWRPAELASIAALRAAEVTARSYPALAAAAAQRAPRAAAAAPWWRAGLAGELEERLP
jgi:acetyl/propionyl-CoA carboxylase alpha subunit